MGKAIKPSAFIIADSFIDHGYVQLWEAVMPSYRAIRLLLALPTWVDWAVLLLPQGLFY